MKQIIFSLRFTIRLFFFSFNTFVAYRLSTTSANYASHVGSCGNGPQTNKQERPWVFPFLVFFFFCSLKNQLQSLFCTKHVTGLIPLSGLCHHTTLVSNRVKQLYSHLVWEYSQSRSSLSIGHFDWLWQYWLEPAGKSEVTLYVTGKECEWKPTDKHGEKAVCQTNSETANLS